MLQDVTVPSEVLEDLLDDLAGRAPEWEVSEAWLGGLILPPFSSMLASSAADTATIMNCNMQCIAPGPATTKGNKPTCTAGARPASAVDMQQRVQNSAGFSGRAGYSPGMRWWYHKE
jgi:hypothetical protein